MEKEGGVQLRHMQQRFISKRELPSFLLFASVFSSQG